MLLLALGLHGVVLLLPIGAKPAPQTSQSPSKKPLHTIKLTELTAPRQSMALPPKPLPSPGGTPQVAVVAPPEIRPTPPSIAAPIEKPDPSPAVAPALPLPSPSASPTPVPLASVPATTDQLQGLFGVPGDGVETPADVQVAPNKFPNPTLFFEPSSLEPNQAPKLRDTILRTVQVDGKSAMQVYFDILVNQGQSNNFQVVEKGTYGAWTVYEVKRDQSTWYFNLVPAEDGTGTIVVVWKQDPSSAM